MMMYSLSFVALAVCSAILTKITLKILQNRAILDHPNERSSHTIPTPRGGGIAIVLITLMAWGALYLQNQPALLYLPVASAMILAVISWVDDLKPLSAKLRFTVQILAVALSLPWVIAVGSLTHGLIPIFLEIILVGVVWVGFINFFNFMDGIDGISGIEAISIGLGLVLLSITDTELLFPDPYLGLSIAAGALGFLYFNWHPAKIFMGDIGSVTIGFLLGGLLLQTAAGGQWAPAIILPLYYLADATITLFRRALRGEKLWQAHREHFYQFAIQQDKSHKNVSIAVGLCNLALIAFAFLARHDPYPALAGAAISVVLLLIWMSRKSASTLSA